ncbi:hypothetical protein SANTM175S_10298 [Streptomyces antimycoticus]
MIETLTRFSAPIARLTSPITPLSGPRTAPSTALNAPRTMPASPLKARWIPLRAERKAPGIRSEKKDSRGRTTAMMAWMTVVMMVL